MSPGESTDLIHKLNLNGRCHLTFYGNPGDYVVYMQDLNKSRNLIPI